METLHLVAGSNTRRRVLLLVRVNNRVCFAGTEVDLMGTSFGLTDGALGSGLK